MDDETEIWSWKHYFFSSQLVLEASSIPGPFSSRSQYIPSLLKQIELGFPVTYNRKISNTLK